MAKIRNESVVGQLGRYNYEVHYAAKEQLFEAKKYIEPLSAFTGTHGRITGSSEGIVQEKFRQVVVQYEKTLDNWTLYIVYKFSSSNYQETRLSIQGYRDFRKGLSIDYDLVYYNQVEGKEYYITKDQWDLKVANKLPQKPNLAWGGDYSERKSRVEHTPELEAFFVAICASMETLIDKVAGVLTKPDLIKELAQSNQKLIG